MTLRRTRFLLAALWLLSLLAAGAVGWRLGRREPPPADAAALAERAAPLGWRAYPLSPLTCYLSDHPLTDAGLTALERDTAHAPEWKGVVWCERGAASGKGTQAGGWVLYGDPAMVRRLADALR